VHWPLAIQSHSRATLSDIAISCYLPQFTGRQHRINRGTNELHRRGGRQRNATLSGPQTTGSYFFLANLDVQNSASFGAVVILVHRLPMASPLPDSNRRWPNDLATRLVNSGRTVGVINQALAGMICCRTARASALNRFNRDVIAQPGVGWVIFSDDPINDLGSSNNRPTGAQLIAGLQQLVSRAHQAGSSSYADAHAVRRAGYWTSAGERGAEQ